jgi:hypothetical protein
MGDFFGSSKDKPTTTNSISAPWDKAQPHLEGQMNAATNTYNTYANPKPWTKNVLSPLHAWQNQGLNQTRNLASQPNLGLNAAQNLTTGLMNNNGMTPELQNVAGLFGQFANSENGLTSGQQGVAGQMNQFADGSMQEDPRLAQALQAREGRAMNGAATMFGGGRYGSAGIGRGMGSAMAEAGNELMLQSNENARNRQLQAQGMLGDLYGTGAGQKLQGAGAMGDLYSGGRAAALASAGLLPAMAGVKYYDSDQLTKAGQVHTDRAQAERDAKIKRYEGQQSGDAQFDQLERLTAALSGMGRVGNSESKSIQPPKRSDS